MSSVEIWKCEANFTSIQGFIMLLLGLRTTSTLLPGEMHFSLSNYSSLSRSISLFTPSLLNATSLPPLVSELLSLSLSLPELTTQEVTTDSINSSYINPAIIAPPVSLSASLSSPPSSASNWHSSSSPPVSHCLSFLCLHPTLSNYLRHLFLSYETIEPLS